MTRARAGTFDHGIHPADHKVHTEALVIERMPLGQRFSLLLGQHIGAPAKAVVRVGDEVRRGQRIADAGGFVSTSLHSPITGRVVSISDQRHPTGALQRSIVIEADPYDGQRLHTEAPVDPATLDEKAFVSHVQRGGLVGLGGAAFPSHVKYAVPDGKVAHTLALNGCECEPFLTSDHRTMVERPDAIVRGVDIIGARLGVKQADIGVELNKLDAIEALEAAVARRGAGAFPIHVRPLVVKYPQGAEKMLIKAMYDKEVPAGALPIDLGVVVNNVSTMASVADWFDRGEPLVDRIVTVSGPAVGRPSNLMVPIGTPIRDVLAYCDVVIDDHTQVVMGGPMMGMPVTTLDAPVLKGTSGLLVFREDDLRTDPAGPCIRCGRCLDACAVSLNPSMFGRLARAGLVDPMEDWHVMDCMECGACTYACPSHIPLIQLIRASKSQIRAKRAKNPGGKS